MKNPRNPRTIPLAANVESTVNITGGNHGSVENRGDGTIYASRYPNIVAGADGVMAIDSHSSKIMQDIATLGCVDSVMDYQGTIYLLATADCDAEINVSNSPNFFKQSLKGGEIVALKQQIASLDEQVNDLMSAGMKRKIVDILPTDDIDENTIYMVPKATAQEGNYYNEFVYTSHGWELIGDAQINLSDYYTKTETEAKFLLRTGGVIDGNVRISGTNQLLVGKITRGTQSNLIIEAFAFQEGLFRPVSPVGANLGTSEFRFQNGYFYRDVFLGNDNTSLTVALNSLAARLSVIDSGANTVI